MATPSSDIPPDGAVPTIKTARSPSDAAWRRSLPLRFNPPPGWPMPGRAWILQHMGRGMLDEWMPVGPLPEPPSGWEWWLPQEPAWSIWMRKEKRSFRGLPWLVAGMIASVIAVSILPLGEWTLILGPPALGFTLTVMATGTRLQRFRRDPVGRLRDRYATEWSTNDAEVIPDEPGALGYRRAHKKVGDFT